MTRSDGPRDSDASRDPGFSEQDRRAFESFAEPPGGSFGEGNLALPSPPLIASGGVLTRLSIREEIRSGRLEIDPYDPARVNPNSVDLTLGPEVILYDCRDGHFDAKTREWNPLTDRDTGGRTPPERITLTDAGRRFLPGDFVIAHTAERTHSPFHVPELRTKSSLARMGVSTVFDAGFGDVGFDGQWTLELTFALPVILYPGLPVCQVKFTTPVGPIERYEGRYNGSTGPVTARP